MASVEVWVATFVDLHEHSKDGRARNNQEDADVQRKQKSTEFLQMTLYD
jgi:hypothetical protein